MPWEVVDMRWGVRDEMTDEHMTTVSLITITTTLNMIIGTIITMTTITITTKCLEPQALCMNELRGCQKYSMGPNFIYFGAQK